MGIKKTNSEEGKHVIFLYNWDNEIIMTIKEGIWRLEFMEPFIQENSNEINDSNDAIEEST